MKNVMGVIYTGENDARLRELTMTRAIAVTASVCGWVILFRVLTVFLDKWFLRLIPVAVQTALISFLELAKDVAEGICGGKTDIAPVRMSGFSACEHCEWRALCQQDPRLGGMPKLLPELSQGEVLKRIRRDVEEAKKKKESEE